MESTSAGVPSHPPATFSSHAPNLIEAQNKRFPQACYAVLGDDITGSDTHTHSHTRRRGAVAALWRRVAFVGSRGSE
jgi:hypothetical protein